LLRALRKLERNLALVVLAVQQSDDEHKIRLAPAARSDLREKYEGMQIDEVMTHIRYWTMAH
jgi:hypothetical protein